MMLLLAFALAPRGWAFCGTYVATESSGPLFNNASQVVLARVGNRTTLTMANDFDGDPTDFAMVVPVPVILQDGDVKVLDPKVFDDLQTYSAPRVAAYTCEELYPEPVAVHATSSGGCSRYASENMAMPAADSGVMMDGGVEIESQFIVGEYEVLILSAEDSGGLLFWLDKNGYDVPPSTESLLQEYIDAGAYFFAAKVDTTLIPAGQDSLSPIQFSYETDVMSLPIRLGTANSNGRQDLIVYAFTDATVGRLGISNYPEGQVESECLYKADDYESWEHFYETRFAEAVDGDEAHWTSEYGWLVDPYSSSCDPCTELAGIPVSDVYALGMTDGFDDTYWEDSGQAYHGTPPTFYFSRLHMRYSPAQATHDLAFYGTGKTDNTQKRYIEYQPYMELEFPICGEGWAADPKSCADEDSKYIERMGAVGKDVGDDKEAKGCTTSGRRHAGVMAFTAFLAGLFLLRRRV